jgi:endonuclease YncB( thermonuclease family)
MIRALKHPLTLVLAMAAAGCARPAPRATVPASNATTPTDRGDRCKLVRWQDGDTAKVECADGADRVRLLGIDTPESGKGKGAQRRARYQEKLWNVPYEAILMCGRAATERAKELCPAGSDIRLIGKERDKYKRRLARIVCNGIDVNQRLVEIGAAGAYPFPDPPQKPRGCPLEGASPLPQPDDGDGADEDQ